MRRNEIFAVVRPLVADSLALREEQVLPESRLIDDLGADSLDFIDLVFTLEKTFRINVREGDFDFLSRLDFSSPAVMREGYLTLETVEKLASGLPAIRELPDPAHVTPGQLFSLITVDVLCRMVERKLTAGERPSAPNENGTR